MKFNTDLFYADSFKSSSKDRYSEKPQQKPKYKNLEDNEDFLRKKKLNKKDYSKERQAKTGYTGE